METVASRRQDELRAAFRIVWEKLWPSEVVILLILSIITVVSALVVMRETVAISERQEAILIELKQGQNALRETEEARLKRVETDLELIKIRMDINANTLRDVIEKGAKVRERRAR